MTVPRRQSKPPKSSLQREMENHPERFPNGTYRKPREGHMTVIFLKRKPKPARREPE